ncbi:hypothetical protein KCP74_15485 [Salmonella enterica subsp. enterica]|nr:hypothetical protein KCP74_15485 [Salmonella enterica subsp. enterica]
MARRTTAQLLFCQTLRSRGPITFCPRGAAPERVWLNWQLKSAYARVLMRYINPLIGLPVRRGARKIAMRTRVNIIPRSCKRYLAASQPDHQQGATPVATLIPRSAKPPAPP